MRKMEFSKLIKTIDQNTKDISDRGTNFEELKRRMQGICASLSYPLNHYQPSKTIESIRKYLEKSDRILYSEISGYFFALDEDDRGNFISNVENLLVTIYSDREESNKKIKDSVLRIYDHVHLALHQVENLQSGNTSDELDSYFMEKLSPVKQALQNQIEDKIQMTQKEIYAQLISLIGIFTAMAFLIFGSITSLDNIFNNFSDTPLSKIMIMGCIWGICVLNLVGIFVYFISKMTKLDLDKNSYLLMAAANVVLIAILLFSIWYYYIKSIGLTEWFDVLAKRHEIITSLSGMGAIIILLFFSIYVLVNRKNISEKEILH